MNSDARHFFLSGNTTEGFYSYFDYIIDQREAERIYCIKGGPGTGKSTFMKQIGQEMEKHGSQLEYMHCSSDCNSVDAVLIKDKKVALIDGTAPHIVDPKNPAAVDEVINLGEFWDREKIKKNKNYIINYNNTISDLYQRAYKYLGASKYIYKDIISIYRNAIDMGAINIYASGIKNTMLKKYPVSNKIGNVRKAFASSVAPQGMINYIDTLVGDSYSTIIVKGEMGTRTDILLENIKNEAIQRGLNVEAYYCILDPSSKIDHLIIPEIKLAILTSNKSHNVDIESERVIDLNKNVNVEKLISFNDEISYNFKLLNELFKVAVDTIKKSKTVHDSLERYYIENMDFSQINTLKNEIVNQIKSI